MVLPKPIDSNRIRTNERLTIKELDKFMKKNGVSIKEFSEILGVTEQAVKLWLTGQRVFSITNSRLIRMFIKWPNLIREF